MKQGGKRDAEGWPQYDSQEGPSCVSALQPPWSSHGKHGQYALKVSPTQKPSHVHHVVGVPWPVLESLVGHCPDPSQPVTDLHGVSQNVHRSLESGPWCSSRESAWFMHLVRCFFQFFMISFFAFVIKSFSLLPDLLSIYLFLVSTFSFGCLSSCNRKWCPSISSFGTLAMTPFLSVRPFHQQVMPGCVCDAQHLFFHSFVSFSGRG